MTNPPATPSPASAPGDAIKADLLSTVFVLLNAAGRAFYPDRWDSMSPAEKNAVRRELARVALEKGAALNL